jgi:transcriptional regulator with XRE-family HTH domain
MSIGRSIKSLRTARGISQKDLAHAAGISPETLRKVERDKSHPLKTTLEKITRELDVPLSVLYLGAIDPAEVPQHKRGMTLHLLEALKKYLLDEL